MATAEACSLLRWLEHYAQQYAAKDREGVASTVLAVLSASFPSLVDAECIERDAASAVWWRVVAALEAFYEMPLGVDTTELVGIEGLQEAQHNCSFVRVLELLLSAVVQCEEKEAYVRDIMSMPDDVQADLMAVIERVMSNNPRSAKECASPRISETAAHSEEFETLQQMSGQTPGALKSEAEGGSPRHLTRQADLDRLGRANRIMKEENIHMAIEIQELKDKHQSAEQENARLAQVIKDMQLQAEMDLLNKERSVRRHFEDRVHSLERELEVAVAELQAKANVAKEVTELRDEVDMLRPTSEKLSKAEARLAKYKDKIEELTSAKEKLKRVEEANTELVEKNLSLEAQVAKAVPLQRKLAEAKEANTEIQFRVSELEAQLARQSADLKAKCAELESSAAALLEASAINKQLQHALDQQMQDLKGANSQGASFGGGAAGISELNPELMERMARLEHENKELKAQVDGTTTDRIDGLLDKLEDMTRVKKSFESKFWQTSEELKAALADLEETRKQNDEWQASHTRLADELAELTQHRDTLSAHLNQARSDIDDWQRKCIQLEHDAEDFQRIKATMEDDLRVLECSCEQQRATIQQFEEKCASLESACEASREDIFVLTTARDNLVLAMEEMRAQLECKDQHTRTLEDRTEQLEMDITTLEARLCESRETSSMLEEDSSRRIALLHTKHDGAIAEMKALHEADVSRLETEKLEAITEMTSEIDEKTNTVDELKESMDELMREHLEAISTQRMRFEAEIQALQEEHDAISQERSILAEEKQHLISRVEDLEQSVHDVTSRFESQESRLRETLRSQLDANRRLVQTNQSLKADSTRKDARIIQLERTAGRLESRMMLLEKEKAHHFSEDGRKRDEEEESSSMSSEISTHVGQVFEEFEQMRKEHKALQQQLATCCCDASARNDSKADKHYFMERIQHLEAAKAQEEDRKRELLLVNAKLVQDQKQFQVKHANVVHELQQLKDRMNVWMLREERRKQQLQVHRQLAEDHRQADDRILEDDSQGDSAALLSLPSCTSIDDKTNGVAALPLSADSIDEPAPTPSFDDEQENVPPPEGESSNISLSSKRSYDMAFTEENAEDAAASETWKPETIASSTPSQVVSTTADVAAQVQRRRPKRRLSHFISNHLATQSTPEADKPSECQPQ